MMPKCPKDLQAGELLPLAVLERWLKACGGGVRIYAGCRIFPPDRVSIGAYSQIDEGVWIYAGAGVAIGVHVHLARGCSISGGGKCVIGDFAGLGAGVRLITGTEEIHGGKLTNPTIPPRGRGVTRGQVVIGAHALLFTNSLVLPGVTIGEGAVVGAGSVVHHSLKPWGIYAGNPLVQVGVRAADPLLRAARELLESEARRGSRRSSRPTRGIRKPAQAAAASR